MDNSCKRNCLWNYEGQCCVETDKAIKDGTIHTKKCSTYLHEDYSEKFGITYYQCVDMIFNMKYSQLKKAKHELTKIMKCEV